jgi:hypothetical protein
MSEDSNDVKNDDRMFTQEEFENKIKDRLKNKSAENIGQKEKIDQLQQQINEMQQAQQTQQPQQPQQPQETQQPIEGQQPNDGTQNGSPLTQESFQQGLEQHQQAVAQQQQQQALEQQVQSIRQKHLENIDKFKKEDPDFEKLASTDNKLGVPEDVALHISSQLSPEKAKDVFKELLSNENSNMKMENARLKTLSGDKQHENAFSDWLKTLISQKSDEKSGAPEIAPDLGNESSSSGDDGSYSNTDDYLNSMFRN